MTRRFRAASERASRGPPGRALLAPCGASAAIGSAGGLHGSVSAAWTADSGSARARPTPSTPTTPPVRPRYGMMEFARRQQRQPTTLGLVPRPRGPGASGREARPAVRDHAGGEAVRDVAPQIPTARPGQSRDRPGRSPAASRVSRAACSLNDAGAVWLRAPEYGSSSSSCSRRCTRRGRRRWAVARRQALERQEAQVGARDPAAGAGGRAAELELPHTGSPAPESGIGSGRS